MAAEQQSRSATRAHQSLSRLPRSSIVTHIAGQPIRTAVYGPVRTVVWEGSGREACPYPDQNFGSKRSISKVDLPSGFFPAELRARLFDVLHAQLSGFSILGVCRLDQSSAPDAGFGSDAGCDVPAIEGGRYTWTGATDNETGLSAGGATGSVVWAFTAEQSDAAVTAVNSKLPRMLRARWFMRALPL